MVTKTRVYSCDRDGKGHNHFDSLPSMSRLFFATLLNILLLPTITSQWTNAGLASVSSSNKDADSIYLREFDLPKSAPRAHAIRFVTKNEEWTEGKEDADTTRREFKLIKTKLDEMKSIQKRKKGGTRLIIDNESEFVGSTDR